jgi:thiol:disulfide interchange protein DsbC
MKHALERRLTVVAVVALLMAGTFGTVQLAQAKSAQSMEQIKAKLQKSFANVKFESVRPSAAWPGLYEVVTESELAYTNADGSLLFAGHIVDTGTKENLTSKRWNELNRIDIKTLPLDNAIKSVKGDGSRTLVVFSDPDCPYCQELEKELQDVSNVTIYTFLYPLESLHPQARDKANNIWCAADRAAVWSNWMLNKTLAFSSCEQTVIASNIELGMKHKVLSTPTLFFVDGQRVNGSISRDEIEASLAAIKK